MAKKENRIIFALECVVCKQRTYTSKKNKLNTEKKIVLSKFCPKCQKHQEHREVKVK